jgi:hypothetical protein
MTVGVNIKQELPVRVGTNQLLRLDIKEPFENTEILRICRSFAAVTGTSGRNIDRNESQCQYQTGIAQ